MPAHKIINSNMIIDKAIILIEEKGVENLNARSLAKSLNCSTQPIYHCFKNMDELINKAKEKIRDDYIIFLNEFIKSEQNYFMGNLYGLIMYAYKHPNLFKIMYMSPYLNDDTNLKFNEQIINEIQKKGDYDKKDATNFFYQSWIFAYGIATQVVTGYLKWDKKDIIDILNLQFESLKKYYRKEK